jgi:hypothetical protein
MLGGRTDIPVCLMLAKTATKHSFDQSYDRQECLSYLATLSDLERQDSTHAGQDSAPFG